MRLARWLCAFTPAVAVLVIAGCSSDSTEGPSSTTSASSGAGGNGGNGGGATSSGSVSSSASSGTGAGGGSPFAACTDTTGSLKDCKNCCDCASQLSCQDQRACRDTCNTLGDTYFAMNPNPMPVMAPSTLGFNGDYSACTKTAATEQECKTCCDCSTNFVCGDHQYCRNWCTATFGDGGLPPPPPDGG